MARINIEDVQPGMVLESDAKDRSGRVLLGAGNTLTEKHLKIFKTWGVTEADIKGIEKEEVAARVISRLDPLRLKEVEAQTRERFRHSDMNHPFTSELFRLLTVRSVRRETGEAEG